MKWMHVLQSSLASALLVVSLSSQAEEPGNSDPWEGFNRAMFSFNEGADKYVLKPITKGYMFITPDPVEQGVSNVFSNLLEVTNVVNGLFQGKLGQAANDTGRFLVNSTVGLVGIFEVAEHLGLEKNEGEDFGQTLAAWGVGQGPYVVWPLLGPSTLRDTGAMPVNSLTDPIRYIDHVPTRNTTMGVELIDTRARLMDAEGLISGDKYSFVRDAYLQRRDYLISDGEIEDDFGSEDDY